MGTKHECNAKYSAGRKLRNEGEACNPDKLFSCGLFFKCEAMLGNTKHKGKCVRRQLPLPIPASGKCNPERPNSCGRGKTCQALLGNTNGEGSCVAASKCWMNMAKFGCKENDGKTSADDGCFATKHECNAKYSAGKCWMNMGQFGCKENDGKTSADDGCFPRSTSAMRSTVLASTFAAKHIRKQGDIKL